MDYVGGKDYEYYTMTNKTPDSYDDFDIAGRVINTAGLYTTVESTLHYSKTLGIFKNKQGTIRHFYGKPNKNLRKKMNYGKTMHNQYMKAGRVLGLLGTGISIYQSVTAESEDARIEYSIDAMIGAAGVIAPELFGVPSTIWFLGGKQVTYWYSNNVITPMIEEGINPGLMIYQPFK